VENSCQIGFKLPSFLLYKFHSLLRSEIGLVHLISKLYYVGPSKHMTVWRKNYFSSPSWTVNLFPSTHLTCQFFLAQTWNIGSRHLPRNFTTWNDVEIHEFTFWAAAGRVAETPTMNCSVKFPIGAYHDKCLPSRKENISQCNWNWQHWTLTSKPTNQH
jgi:hypothetical protein